MTKTVSKVKRWLTVVTASLLAVHAMNANALLMGFDPEFQMGEPGNVVSLNLFADEIMGTAIGDYDLDILYDSAALTLNSVTFAGALGVDAINGAFSVPGVVDLFEVSVLDMSELITLQSGGLLLLATLMFTIDVLAQGASTFVSIDTNDPFLIVGNGAGHPLDIGLIDFTEAEIRNDPRPVSEPTGLVLLALGALALRRLTMRARVQPNRS